MRFSPSESGIEKVGHILCFRAGHIPIRGELSTAYCLLEFTCNLPQDRRFEVISIFREIAHMGALNEALVDNEVTMRRQYVHGFAKPIRAILDCNEDVRYIGNSLVEASTFDGSAAGLGVKLQTLCTITNDIASRIHDQAITALRLSDFPQRFDVAEAVVRETSYFNKSFKNKCIKCNGVSIMVYLPEVYLRALLFQVLLNAKDHGDPKAEIFVGWGLGVDPVVLAESIDLDDKDRETLEKLDRMVGGSDVVLLVHNRRQQSGGIRSGVGLLAIDDMASVLGGRAFHLDNDRSFFSLSIFPDTVVKRSGHGSEEALTGESHQ